MAGTPTPRPSSASEREKLIEQYEQSKRSEAERDTNEKVQAIRRKRTTRIVILGSFLAITLVLAFRPPAWILPAPQPAPTPAQREAGIRFAIYLQAQQVEHFRSTRGRLPTTLAETGEPLPGIQYAVLSGASYRLRSTGIDSIVFNSNDSLTAFLGESMAQLGPAQ